MQLTPNRFDYWENPALQRGWALLRFELLFLFWAIMEMAIITPLALAIFSWTAVYSPAQIATGVLCCIMLPFYLARGLTWYGLSRLRQRQILMVTAVFVVIFTIRNLGYESSSLFDMSWIGQFFRNLTIANDNSWQRDLGLFALITVSWWRGIMLVSSHIDTSRFGQRFTRLSLYLLPAIIVVAAFRDEWSNLSFVTLYFATSLITMMLTRVEQAERKHGSILTSMSPRWLTAVSVTSLFITFLASGTALFVSGSWQRLTAAFGPIWSGLQLSLSTSLLTLAYLASPFLLPLENLFNFLIRIFQRGFDILFEAAPPPEENDFQGSTNEWLIETLTQPPSDGILANTNWRIVLLILLIILIVVATILVGRYFQADKTVQEPSRFRNIMTDISRRLTPPRFQKKEKGKNSDWRDWKTAVSIINIYQNMLNAAAQFGYPRDESETPYEFLTTLKLIWPEHHQEVKIITNAYVNIKYGQFPESKEELQSIQDSWRIIKDSEPIILNQENS